MLSSKQKQYSLGTVVCRPATLGSRPEDSAFVLALLGECLKCLDLLFSELSAQNVRFSVPAGREAVSCKKPAETETLWAIGNMLSNKELFPIITIFENQVRVRMVVLDQLLLESLFLRLLLVVLVSLPGWLFVGLDVGVGRV